MADKKDDSPFLTTGERLRNFVGIAFVVSLLLHAAAVPLFPNLAQHHEDEQVEKTTVQKKPTVVHTPPPTPPPTPQPKQTPVPQKHQQQQQTPLKVAPPHVSSNSGTGPSETKYVPPANGNSNGVPGGTAATAGPTGPPATPKPACATPQREATASNTVSPEYPESAREAGLGEVTALVKVTIGPTGSLVDASISQSSGNMAIDQSALRAARQSTYTPELVDCVPTTGSYIFHATFSPDN